MRHFIAYPIIYPLYLSLLKDSLGLVSKQFEKKSIKTSSFENAETKTLHKSSQCMDKITCSSLCLKYSEDCDAFHINENNECIMVKNPEELQELSAPWTGPVIWTAKSPKPATKHEFVLVSGGRSVGDTEILG